MHGAGSGGAGGGGGVGYNGKKDPLEVRTKKYRKAIFDQKCQLE